MLDTMARRRRRRARKPCLVSASQARGRTEASIPEMLLTRRVYNTSMPVLLLPANCNENVDPDLVIPRRSKKERIHTIMANGPIRSDSSFSRACESSE
jgi:hypothetical protein